ncbi:hypothetical protein ACFL4G_04345 [Thermodesulfobacteriota bacterium]
MMSAKNHPDHGLPERIYCPHCGRSMLLGMQRDREEIICSACASRHRLTSDMLRADGRSLGSRRAFAL